MSADVAKLVLFPGSLPHEVRLLPDVVWEEGKDEGLVPKSWHK